MAKRKKQHAWWKQLDYSQRIVLVILAFAMICIALSYILPPITLWLFGEAVESNTDLSISLVESVIYVVAVYSVYHGALKISRNVHGIAKDGVPYSIKEKYEDIFESDIDEELDENVATESYDPDSAEE